MIYYLEKEIQRSRSNTKECMKIKWIQTHFMDERADVGGTVG